MEKARQSIRAAETLKQDGFLDFAASRAYYAMFYTAEALLIEQDLAYSSHSAVIAAYGRKFARTGKLDPKFHCFLLDAQESSNVGDYGIGPGVSEEQVQDSLHWADEFLRTAQEFLRGESGSR